jgi:hypothetical protein
MVASNAALRLKGYSLNEVAAIVGVSKDTLRKALPPPKKAKKKMAAHETSPGNGPVASEETKLKTAPGQTLMVPPGRKRKFPSGDDL